MHYYRRRACASKFESWFCSCLSPIRRQKQTVSVREMHGNAITIIRKTGKSMKVVLPISNYFNMTGTTGIFETWTSFNMYPFSLRTYPLHFPFPEPKLNPRSAARCARIPVQLFEWMCPRAGMGLDIVVEDPVSTGGEKWCWQGRRFFSEFLISEMNQWF